MTRTRIWAVILYRHNDLRCAKAESFMAYSENIYASLTKRKPEVIDARIVSTRRDADALALAWNEQAFQSGRYLPEETLRKLQKGV